MWTSRPATGIFVPAFAMATGAFCRIGRYETKPASRLPFCSGVYGSGIENAADRHLVRERGDAADVVAVIVRDDEVVDPLDAGILHRSDDALGVAPWRVQVTCVEQQGLPDAQDSFRGRDDERGLPSFGVDEVNVRRDLALRLAPITGSQQRHRRPPRATSCASLPPFCLPQVWGGPADTPLQEPKPQSHSRPR